LLKREKDLSKNDAVDSVTWATYLRNYLQYLRGPPVFRSNLFYSCTSNKYGLRQWHTHPHGPKLE
jgi:hypothetical protein